MTTTQSSEHARASRLFTFATMLGTVGLGILAAGCSSADAPSREPVAAEPAGSQSAAQVVTHAVPGDFDGDHRSDPAMWRPSSGQWLVKDSSNGLKAPPVVLGTSTDNPVLGDFDHDGKMDYTVYHPANNPGETGVWQTIFSSTGLRKDVGWGEPGDIPVPGDYDGDGKTDRAVFRPGNGFWLVANADATAAMFKVPLGDWRQDKYLVPGDYDFDGKTDFAVYTPGDHKWQIHFSTPQPDSIIQWGASGDIPVPGDYDGDGFTDVAQYRPNGNLWIIRKPNDPSHPRIIGWGQPDDVLIPGGDFDNDGVTDCALYRPGDSSWLPLATDPFVVPDPNRVHWGIPGDVPLLNTQIIFVPQIIP